MGSIRPGIIWAGMFLVGSIGLGSTGDGINSSWDVLGGINSSWDQLDWDQQVDSHIYIYIYVYIYIYIYKEETQNIPVQLIP